MAERTREQELLDRIHELRLLRDAQDPGGGLYARFQADIEEVTHALLHWREIEPQVLALQAELAEAHRALAQAEAGQEPGQDPFSPPATVAGVLGALLVLVSLWLDLSGVWSAAGWCLLVIAAGCLALSVSHRSGTAGDVGATRDRVGQLSARLDALSGTPKVVSAEVLSAEVLPLGGDGPDRDG